MLFETFVLPYLKQQSRVRLLIRVLSAIRVRRLKQMFIPVYHPVGKGAGTAHNKKDGDAIVQFDYEIASPSFLLKLEA